MASVLVTGGAGFIGSHTVDALVARGHHVRVLDALQKRVHPQGAPDYLPASVELLVGDVADPATMRRALDGVEYVLHLAAYQDYMPDFSTFVHVNAESSALIFELVVSDRLPVRKIVFASSQSVAGEGLYRCPEHGELTPGPRPPAELAAGDWEHHCPHCRRVLEPLPIPETVVSPHTAYAISKHTIEQLAGRLGERYGIATACMRYTYVQGPRNSLFNAYSGILRRFALRIQNGLAPICYEDGGQLRDYINVADVAAANVLAMESPSAEGVYNVGGGRWLTVLEFAHIVLQAFGSDLEPGVPGEYRLGDTRHTFSDIGRLRGLGWEPRVPVEQSVREYLDWIARFQDTLPYLEEAERVMREQGVVKSVAS